MFFTSLECFSFICNIWNKRKYAFKYICDVPQVVEKFYFLFREKSPYNSHSAILELNSNSFDYFSKSFLCCMTEFNSKKHLANNEVLTHWLIFSSIRASQNPQDEGQKVMIFMHNWPHSSQQITYCEEEWPTQPASITWHKKSKNSFSNALLISKKFR